MPHALCWEQSQGLTHGSFSQLPLSSRGPVSFLLYFQAILTRANPKHWMVERALDQE